MQIRFADRRPDGDYALVLPVAGKQRSALNALGGERTKVESTLQRQRLISSSVISKAVRKPKNSRAV